MARTSLKRAFFLVLNYLRSKGTATKMEIVKATGLSWESVTKVLEVLEGTGTVKTEKVGKNVVVKLLSDAGSGDYYFSIRLDREKDELLRRLYGTIKRVWRKVGGRDPNPIEVQKTAVKVISELSLDIPTGRYLYGVITPLKYREDVEYPELEGDVAKKAQKVIADMVRKYVDAPLWEIVEDQHREMGLDKYYEALRDVESARGKKQLLDAIKKLMMLVKSDRSSEMLSRLYGAVYSFYNENNPIIELLRSIVLEYVKTEEFRHDLEKSGSPKEGLSYMETVLREKEEEVEELLLSLIPP